MMHASLNRKTSGGCGGGGNKLLPGHFLVPDFVSEEEETALLAFLDAGPETVANPWKPSRFNGAHRGGAATHSRGVSDWLYGPSGCHQLNRVLVVTPGVRFGYMDGSCWLSSTGVLSANPKP
jgi:hypothetical protein